MKTVPEKPSATPPHHDAVRTPELDAVHAPDLDAVRAPDHGPAHTPALDFPFSSSPSSHPPAVELSRSAAPRTERAATAPPPARRPDRRSIQRLQRMAGNGAVSRLVAQRYTAPVKPSPAQSAGFRKVKADVAGKKTRLAAHAPAASESKASQDAAVAPPDDKEAQGKAANAEKMNAAKPGEFDKKAFIDAVNKAIDSQAPKNLDEADKFAKSGKADQVKAEVDGKVTDGKESSAKDIDTATKAPPDTSAAKDKDVTPLSPDQPPGNPGAPSATDAVPEKQPAAVTDFSEGPAENDKAMADAEVTEEQLAKGNEPEFNEALSAKKTSEADAAKAPAKGKAAEDQQLSTAKQNAAASGAQAMAGLTATRATAGKQVDGGKSDTKSKDEKKRAEVTAKLQKVYDGTKKDVEDTLSGLDKKVDTAFTSGEKSARDAFTADHKSRMKKYKDKRYSGLMGKGRWIKDKFAGLPKAANDLYQESRKLYVSRMQTVISSVADIIGAELGKAKARIAKGRTELKAEVDKLPADLKQFGEEAAKDFAGKFDDLEATVNEKSEQLVQDLAQKYTAALNKIDEEIKKLQEANKGLIDKAKDAIVGAIKTINELKNLLLGILAKAASAIMKIIKDPIGFLGNLVKAVGAGLNLFITNIADHLKTGVVSWLLGTAVKAGLDLPARFDLKGIIQLIGSMLSLTWDNIRTRITRKGVPDEAMSAVETSVPVAKNLAAEGPAGAVKEIQAEAGDLKATILGKLTTYLIPTVLIAGITWIISLLNPASAFVRAVKGIIDIVTFIVTQGAQIADFVNAVLDAVIAIANGGQAGVPKLIEAALATSVPLLIGFLAALLGIGGLANKVKSVFQSVSRPVTRAIDKIVDFIAKKGKALWAKLRKRDDYADRGDSRPAEGDRNRSPAKESNPKADPKHPDKTYTTMILPKVGFRAQDGEHHSVLFEGQGRNANLIVRSDPTDMDIFLKSWKKDIDEMAPDSTSRANQQSEYDNAIRSRAEIRTLMGRLPRKTRVAPAQQRAWEQSFRDLRDQLNILATSLSHRSPAPPEPPQPVLPAFVDGVLARGFTAHYLNNNLRGEEAETHTTVHPKGWAYIRSHNMAKGSAWVRMHLLPAPLGGLVTWSNLVPARGTLTNIAFRDKVEHPAQRALSGTEKIIWYQVEVSYHSEDDTNQHVGFPSYIRARWAGYEVKNGRWEPKDPTGAGQDYSQSPPLPPTPGTNSLLLINHDGRRAISAVLQIPENVARKIRDARENPRNPYEDATDLIRRLREEGIENEHIETVKNSMNKVDFTDHDAD